MVCISHFENVRKQLFKVKHSFCLIKKKKKTKSHKKQIPLSWETSLCRSTVFEIISSLTVQSAVFLCCVSRSGPTIMKQLSEKTGLEKIQLMLIWPLGYHPAGKIWQTSAICAVPLLITLLHSRLSSA